MQHDYNLANDNGLNFRTDLNNALSAIMSQNSGATAPTTTVAGMFWYDTSTTPSVLKQRDDTDTGWNILWVAGVGQLAPLASPTFTGNVTLPSTTYIGGVAVAVSANQAFTGTATFEGITATGTITLPSTTSIGLVSATEISYLDGVTSAIQTQLNAKAPLASPAFTGTPTAPTATTGTNTTQIATTAFVQNSLGAFVSGGLPQNSQTFTSSGTFVVPAGVYKVMVMACGGGGGGGGPGSTGGDGGNSVFGTSTFYGGGGGSSSSYTSANTGAGGNGGTGGGAGSSGGSSQFGKGAGGGEGEGGITVGAGGTGYGSGGAGGQRTATVLVMAGGGGSSSYTSRIVAVTPAQNITVTVGSGGAGGVANGYTGGGAGSAGKVIIYW